MRIDILAPAKSELLDAIEYYNGQSEGLGFEFAVEFTKTMERIIKYPAAWPSLSKRTRRCRANRFPYGIVYQIREDSLLIVAVMHLHQKPLSWKSRL